MVPHPAAMKRAATSGSPQTLGEQAFPALGAAKAVKDAPARAWGRAESAPSAEVPRQPPATMRAAAAAKGSGRQQANRPAETAGLVAQLQAMGFSEAESRAALAAHAWSVNEALDGLLTSRSVMGKDGTSSDAGTGTTDVGTGPGLSPAHSESGDSVGLERSLAEDAGDVEGADAGGAARKEAAKAPPKEEAGSVQAPAEKTQQAPATADDHTASTATAAAAGQETLPAAEQNEAPVACRRLVQRVNADWAEAAAGDVLEVRKDVFVSVWTDTKTESGWVYADRLADGRGGWLPTSLLASAPAGRAWMKVKDSWKGSDSTHLSIEAGNVLLVHVDSKTSLGWAYAQVEEAGKEQAAAGWVPECCLDWALGA